jgi:uncharacterized protein with WD repeat
LLSFSFLFLLRLLRVFTVHPVSFEAHSVKFALIAGTNAPHPHLEGVYDLDILVLVYFADAEE